jgi:hypothetical protein
MLLLSPVIAIAVLENLEKTIPWKETVDCAAIVEPETKPLVANGEYELFLLESRNPSPGCVYSTHQIFVPLNAG